MLHRLPSPHTILLLAACLIFPALAFSQSTWTGSAGTNWNNASNWTGGIPTINTVLNFGGTITNQPTDNDIVGLTTGAINFTNNGLAHTTAFTLGTLGQSVTLGGDITTTAIAGGGTPITDIINLNLVSSAIRFYNIGLSHDLTIYGSISGTGGVRKVGAGVLTLAGANSYGNSTIIESGALKLGAANVLPGTTVEIRRAAGTDTNPFLDLNGFSDTIGGITLGSATTSGTNTGQTVSIINSGAAATLTIGGNVTYLAGSAGFQNGQATISANLDLNNTGATSTRLFTVADSANAAIDLLISGNISVSSGTSPIRKDGAGLLRISGNNTWNGSTTVRQGTLQLGSSTALTTSSPRDLFFTHGEAAGTNTNTILDLNGFNATVSSITLSSGSNTIGNLQSQIIDSAGTAGILTLNGGVTYITGATSLHHGQSTISAKLNLNGSTRTFSIADSVNTTQEVVISGDIQNSSGTAGLTKTGLGVLVLSGANTYNGITTVTAGVLRLDHASALPGGIGATGGTSALTINDAILGLGNGNFTRALGTGVDQVQLPSTGSPGFAAYGADRVVNLGGASAQVTWGSGSFLTGTNNFALSHATATHTVDFQNPIALGGSRRLVVNDGAATVDGRLSGAITGAFSLTKAGAGTLELTNTGNAWTGTTNIESGTLRLAAANVLPDASTVNIRRAAGTDTNPVLDLNGFSDTVGQLTLGSATTSSTNTGQTVSIINSGAAAALTIGANVLYQAGSAGFQNGQATISANLHLSAQRSFAIDDSANAPIDLLVSGDISSAAAASLVKTSAGLMKISGNNTYTGSSLIQQGTLQLGSNTALSSSAAGLTFRVGLLAANTTAGILDLNGFNASVNGVTFGDTSAVGNVQAQIIDSAGGGLLTLNGGVTYNAGSASFNHGQSTISANLNLNGGTRSFTIADSANTTQEVVVSGNIQNSSGTAGLTKAGLGVLVLSGANTYNGTTTVSAGTLQLGSGGSTGSIANSTSISVGTGATLVTARDGTLNLTQAITGAGNVNISNAATGTTVLGSVTNAYTGTTTVTAGALQVGSGGTGQTGTGAVTVQTGSTLMGTGVIRGNTFDLQAGGTLRPGDSEASSSHGTLTFTPTTASGSTSSLQGSIILGISGATTTDATFGGNILGSAGYNAWLDGITGTGTHDRLDFNNPTSGSGYNLNFLTTTGSLQVVGSGFTPAVGQVFNLLDWAGLVTTNFTGFTFNIGYLTGNSDEGTDLDLPDLTGSGLAWDFSRFTSSGNIIIVPESSRTLLLMLGLTGLLTRRRRK